MPVTVGGASNSNWIDAAPRAVAVSTVTGTFPAGSEGVTATSSFGDTTVKVGAGAEPKLTRRTLTKPRPVILTRAPPDVGPSGGDTTQVTDGVGLIGNCTRPVLLGPVLLGPMRPT